MNIEETLKGFCNEYDLEYVGPVMTGEHEGKLAVKQEGMGHACVDPVSGMTESQIPKLKAAIEKALMVDEIGVEDVELEPPCVPARTPARTAPHATAPAVAMPDKQIADLTLSDITQYICPNATEQEAFMFLQLCQARRLNPFLNDAYLIKYGTGKAQTVVGKDAFMRRAESHPMYDGFKAGIVVDVDGVLDFREGTFMTPVETLVGGWAKVYRKDVAHPFKMTVSMDEYAKPAPVGKKPNSWDKIPATMIRKVPLVQGLREAFPSEFSGMYDKAEMGVD